MSAAEEEPVPEAYFNPGAKAGVAFGIILSVLLLVGVPVYIKWRQRREGFSLNAADVETEGGTAPSSWRDENSGGGGMTQVQGGGGGGGEAKSEAGPSRS